MALPIRDRLLDAAVQLLHEQGIAALTQPKVAKAAGVTQSHLTYYFPTRAALLLAVAEHSIGHLLQGLQAELAQHAGEPQWLAQQLGVALVQPERARLMLGLLVASDEDAQVRAALREFIARMRARMTLLLQLLVPGITATQVALFHSSVAGSAMLNLIRQDEDSAAEVRAVISEVLALLQRPAAPVAPESDRP